MPPGPNAGSLDERPRADLAKSMQNCLPSLVLAFASNAVMPAEEPSGRAIAEQPDLVGDRVPDRPGDRVGGVPVVLLDGRPALSVAL